MNLIPEDLKQISTRTLIVYGDRDPLYSPSMALEMQGAFPNAELWIIKNGGHSPVFLERSGEFVKRGLDFPGR